SSCAFKDALNPMAAFLADINVPVLSPLSNCHSLLLSGLPPLQEQRDSSTHTWSVDLLILIVLYSLPCRFVPGDNRIKSEAQEATFSFKRNAVIAHPSVDGPWLHLQQLRDFLQR